MYALCACTYVYMRTCVYVWYSSCIILHMHILFSHVFFDFIQRVSQSLCPAVSRKCHCAIETQVSAHLITYTYKKSITQALYQVLTETCKLTTKTFEEC